jgi:hypothetical protein
MTDLELDDEGYPTEETLRLIREWSAKDCTGLIDAVGAIWNFRSWGWHANKQKRREYKGGPLSRTYHISTGGWSGNESLISAMRDNWMFWLLSWHSSRVGGHYVFRVADLPRDTE